MRFPPSQPRRRAGFVVASLGRRWPYLWAFAVGGAFAVRVIGWDFLTGDPSVVRVVAGDNAAGLAAFRAFVDDGWRWPVLYTPTFGDRGVNVAFSDSIPVLAIAAKLAHPLGIGAEAWWAGWFWAVYGL
ncbi:MAG: hypothetical protein OEV40_21040, partial [Acidimicrobiia bacterium]|nr:hypothetical protein [Acidimicrobiia bacterium]